MIKRLYFVIVLAFLVVGCNESSSQPNDGNGDNENRYKVMCEVANAPKGKVFLEQINGQNFVTKETIDVPEDGKFSFEGEIKQPDFYRVRFFNGQFFFLVLSADEIGVTCDASNIFETIKFTNSKDSELFNTFVVENSKRTNKLKALQAEYQERLMRGDQLAQSEFQEKYNQVVNEGSQSLKKMIEDNVSSIIAPYLALSLDAEAEYQYLAKISKKIDEAQSNQYQKALSNKISSLKSLAIGQPAPELAFPNPQGQILKLSDYKGKVVLIDFWASWCRPCRAENPNVVRLYKEYKDKDFEIFGVSLDKSKDAWVKAIENDGITWPQVSDLKFWSSEAAKIYQVSSIPRTYLIDKEGNILAKNLRGEALEAKLREVLGE